MSKNYTFNGQREGEQVVGVIKTHPIVLVAPGVKLIIFFLVALAIILYLPANEYLSLLSIILFLAGISFFSSSVNYFKESVVLLTDQRVISIEQRGFWKRKITEVGLGNIQDMSSSISGFLGSIFKCGDLIIRSAGASSGGEMVVRNIYHPYDLQQEIAGKMSKSSQLAK